MMASLAATATTAGQIMQGAMPRLAAGGAPAIFEVAAAGFGKVPVNPYTALMTAAALGTTYGAYKGYEWYQDRERAKENQAVAEREDLKQAYESSRSQQGQAWLQRHTYNLAAADTAVPGVYNPSTDKGKERVSGSSTSHCETTDPVEGWVDEGFTTEPTKVQILSTPIPESARPGIEGFDQAPSSINITLEGFEIYDGPQIQILTNAASSSEEFRGGAYGQLPCIPGWHRHHMPADSVNGIPSTYAGPAIQMEMQDHRLTSSFGNSSAAQEYRKEIDKLISQDKQREAMAKEIWDVKASSGSKYNKPMQDMLEYAKKIGYLDKK